MKVLIVEDDQFLSKMYQKKFEVEGFEVKVAYDGEQGLELMRSFMPDIVCMDIMMPKLNGLEATQRAKADPALQHIPILVLTNLSSSDDAQTAVKKGAVDFMVKSDFTPAQIIDKVKTILAAYQPAVGSNPSLGQSTAK
jgi:DNA-binding response OmpR family regulator